MMNKPNILTAVPKRRYRYGEFEVVVLGEIETSDANQYRFIAAVLKEGEPEPGVYLTAEKNSSTEAGNGRYAMRLIMAEGDQLVRSSDHWRDAQVFSDDVLDVVGTLLDLGDEQPFQLM